MSPCPDGVPIVFNATTLGALAVDNSQRLANHPLFDHVFTLLPDRSDLRCGLAARCAADLLPGHLADRHAALFPASVRIAGYQSFVVGRRVMWSMSLLYTFRMCSLPYHHRAQPRAQLRAKVPAGSDGLPLHWEHGHGPNLGLHGQHLLGTYDLGDGAALYEHYLQRALVLYRLQLPPRHRRPRHHPADAPALLCTC